MAMAVARPPQMAPHHHAAGSGGSGNDDAEPDALEIVQFARYLGMDPIEDCAFLWIAEQALVAPLPDDWSEHMDAEGNVYYYNVVTDESSWEHPMDQYYRNLFLKVQREHEEKKAKEEEERRREEMERQDREKAARLMEEERLLARERAALLIQRNYRGRLGRKKYLRHLDEMDTRQRHMAAAKVQAVYRGHRVRRCTATRTARAGSLSPPSKAHRPGPTHTCLTCKAWSG
jgi:hypothetical protein|eukprot:COSAG01_NODE_9593_length_2397_cov_1.800783_1_plen_231_part_00